MSLHESGKVSKVKYCERKQEMTEKENNNKVRKHDKHEAYGVKELPNFLLDDIEKIDTWLQGLGVKKINRDKFIETVKTVRQEYEDTNPSRS